MKLNHSYIKKANIIFAFFLLQCIAPLKAQTFKAAVVAGGNASQINGDLIAGFDKLGLHGGLKVSVDMSERFEASVELLYSERGSSSKVRAFEPFKIKINYVEVPLLMAYKDWLRDDYYKMRFEAGISLARLIDSRVDTINGDLMPTEFNETDISGLVGVTFYSSPALAFSFRYNHSINFLINNLQHPRFPRLRGYFLTFRLLYFL